MREPLTAFAPRRCLESGLLEHGGFIVQNATVLFLDLAGFTSLTERLGKVGSRGTEQLSQLLRGFFGAVTEVVMDLGGDPVAFGGDALTVVFDGSPELTLSAATDSAAAIQRLAREMAGTPTLAGPATLETRIGIARGSVTAAVANSTRRAIPVHLGPGLDLAVAAEAQAEPGQVVLHPSATLQTPSAGSAKPLRSAVAGASSPVVLGRLVHPVVLGRLTEGRALLESHRSITVAFIHFPPVAARDLPSFLRRVGRLLELVDGFGGELVQVSGGDKGMVAMVVLGAPVTHGDDPLRAIEIMLELRRQERSAMIGIATGPVFAALLGSERRRFSAHSGQAVILAARLMQAAAPPGQILVDATTWHATSAHLRQKGRPFRLVKGRDEPVEIRAVAGWRRGRRRVAAPADPPLAGREAALMAVERLLDDLAAGRGRMLEFAGESGIGKSRLVRETIQRAAMRGTTVVNVDTDDHPRVRSAGLWRDLVGQLTGTPARAGQKQWLKALTACLPDAAAQLPLLGPLLGVRLGDPKAVPRLPPDLEIELVHALVAQLSASATAERPLLLVVENTHHLDQGSQTLLESLGRSLSGSRAGVLVTRRTDGGSTPAVVSVERQQLGELTDPEVALLAEDVWRQSGGGSPPTWLPVQVSRRAGGNPLFVRTVTELLHEHWAPGEPPPSADFAAGTLSGLLAERVDRLPPAAHQLLNVLAVAREPCSLAVASELMPKYLDERTAASAALTLVAEHLVKLVNGDTEVRYRLLHDVLQHVVYAGMSHAERVRIHRRLSEYLSTAGADPIEVASHVDRLNEPALARRWFPLAAASARASWNLPDAVSWWQRVLPLLSGTARDSAEVELLEVLLVAGRANEVLEAVGGARQLPPLLSARRLHAVAEAALICGDLDRSEAAALEAMQLTEDNDEARHQRAAELRVLVHCARGDFREATRTAQEHLERALRVGDLRAVTTAEASLGAALLHAGIPETAAVHYEEARRGAVTLGDVVQEVHVLSDLAGCAFETARHEDCVELLARARESADAIGYRRHLAFNLSNEAQLRAALGDAHATTCAAAAVQRSLEMGDLPAAANALHTWLTSDAVLNADPNRWHRLHAIDSHLGRGYAVAADAADLAVAAARRGRTEDALRAADEAIRTARDTDQASVLRRATLARLLAARRQTGTADAAARATFVAGLESLLDDDRLSEVEHAELGIERWRATRALTDRETAVSLLHHAFAVEPSTVVRRWFGEIGEPLPAPPSPLPPPVGIGRARTTRAELEESFRRLESASASVSHH